MIQLHLSPISLIVAVFPSMVADVIVTVAAPVF